MFLKSILLFIMVSLSLNVMSQRNVYRNNVLSSLECGKMPEFSKDITSFFKNRNESAVVLYHLLVDTNGTVKEYKRIPIIGIGNTLDSSSHVWDDIYLTIEKSIKGWKFKPDYWKLEDKKLESELNSKAGSRPHGGYQYFFVFFKINSDIEHNPIYIDIFN